jgi:hypothetical protein
LKGLSVTVSEEGRLHRGSLTAEERAEWAVKAWELIDEQDMSFRDIQRKWMAEHGFYVSHVTIRKWVNQVRREEKLLELYEAEDVRLGLLGKYENYQRSIRAAMDTGELDFEPGMKLLLSVAKEIAKLANAAVAPTNKVEVTGDAGQLSPNLALFNELQRAVNAHEHKTRDMEENDGLDG